MGEYLKLIFPIVNFGRTSDAHRKRGMQGGQCQAVATCRAGASNTEGKGPPACRSPPVAPCTTFAPSAFIFRGRACVRGLLGFSWRLQDVWWPLDNSDLSEKLWA